MAKSDIGLDVTRIGDASHLEFNGSKDWKYELKRGAAGGDRVVLRLPSLKPETIARLKTYSDKMIKSITVNEKGIDDTVEVTFTLGAGADFFDYLTDQPSRLIVDFFPKETDAKPATAVAAAPAAPAQLPLKKTAGETIAKKPRQVAKEDDEDPDDEEDDVPHGKSSAGGVTRDISADITGIAGSKVGFKKAKDGSRVPAGTDFITVGKNDALPSLAEKLSEQKDFSHGIFDGGDPEFRRFSIKDYEVKENSIIASRANFYLPFPMLDLGNPHLKALIDTPPTYEIIPNDSRENKEARVLLTLYSTGKLALFMKTSEEFLKKHPQSEYDEIIRYMRADTRYGFWRQTSNSDDFEVAMGEYQSLTEKYPDSPITPRTMLIIGYSFMDRNDSFGALKAFQRFTRAYPNAKQIDQVNISIAEAYLKLNRYDDTLALLDKVAKDGKTAKARQEAAFRKGGVFFRKRDWSEAIKNYKDAIDHNKDVATLFPNAYYNIAEAEFNRGHFREALEAYRTFLQKFPDHDYGGYAMTRMGELLSILGADPKRAQGAFLESYFRYRATPGAGVARIRTLASRMPEMKDKELANSLREIASITDRYANHPKIEEPKVKLGKDGKPVKGKEAEAKKEAPKAEEPPKEAAKPAEGGKEGEGGKEAAAAEPEPEPKEVIGEAPEKIPELPGIEEFSALLEADGFNARHEYDRAANDLITYYQKNPQSPNKERFRKRIVENMTAGIRAAEEKGDFIEALRRWSKNSSGWLKNTDRVDVKNYVGRAYEQAGVFKEAANIYRDNLKSLGELKAKGQEREHQIFENLPTTEQIELRLAAVAAKENDYASAETHLKNIKNVSALNPEEQVERVELAADISEARGQSEVAKKYVGDLIKTWKGSRRLTGPLYLRLARLYGQSKNFNEAEANLHTILDGDEVNELNDDVRAKAMELRGDLHLARGKRGDAVKAYQALLEVFETKRPLASIRYKVGQILYQDGDLKGAQKAWADLKPEKDGLYARLAGEQMQSAKWQNEYKKYLNRIPAATELR